MLYTTYSHEWRLSFNWILSNWRAQGCCYFLFIQVVIIILSTPPVDPSNPPTPYPFHSCLSCFPSHLPLPIYTPGWRERGNVRVISVLPKKIISWSGLDSRADLSTWPQLFSLQCLNCLNICVAQVIYYVLYSPVFSDYHLLDVMQT